MSARLAFVGPHSVAHRAAAISRETASEQASLPSCRERHVAHASSSVRASLLPAAAPHARLHSVVRFGSSRPQKGFEVPLAYFPESVHAM